jgi:hypothetical protein
MNLYSKLIKVIMHEIRRILSLLRINEKSYRSMELKTTSANKQKRTSNKSKLKQTKSRPDNKYNSSKPIKSKAVGKFRNKSNI